MKLSFVQLEKVGLHYFFSLLNEQVSYLSELDQLIEGAGSGRVGVFSGKVGVVSSRVGVVSSRVGVVSSRVGVVSSAVADVTTKKARHATTEEGGTLGPSASFPPRRHPRAEQEVSRKEGPSGGTGRRGRRTVKERSQHEGTTVAQARVIYKVYTPIDNGAVKDAPIVPIM